MKTPFKMAGMSFKGESPVRENKVGKFIKSKVDNVKANVKGVVDRVKSIGSGGSSEDNNDAEENTIKVAGNNTKINSSKTAQTSASSSIEDTLPKTPMAKRAPTRNYKKGYYKKQGYTLKPSQ